MENDLNMIHLGSFGDWERNQNKTASMEVYWKLGGSSAPWEPGEFPHLEMLSFTFQRIKHSQGMQHLLWSCMITMAEPGVNATPA